ncbi:MAG: hypothetical protein IGS39_10805 [Calothrix sp. C42_A2020_038]|nr:hypothetical protein [Calothrix sp. C42_A2020_038]
MQLFTFDQIKKKAAIANIFAVTATAGLLATVLPLNNTNTTANNTLVREFNTITTSREAEQNSPAALILAAAAIGGLTFGVWQVKKGSNQTGTSYSRYNFQHQDQGQNTLTIDQINGKLRTQLLSLLHRDIPAANRLLTQAKFKYPNRTTNWYAEKVIYDLTRDRGGY